MRDEINIFLTFLTSSLAPNPSRHNTADSWPLKAALCKGEDAFCIIIISSSYQVESTRCINDHVCISRYRKGDAGRSSCLHEKVRVYMYVCIYV